MSKNPEILGRLSSLHYTISEDRSGTQESVSSKILSVLGDRRPQTRSRLASSDRVKPRSALYDQAPAHEPESEYGLGVGSIKDEAVDDGADGADDPGGLSGLGNMFNDPHLIQKLAANPKTAPYLADPDFVAKLQRVAKNPNGLSQEISDPRFLQVMGVLLGIDLQSGQPPEGASDRGGDEQDAERAHPNSLGRFGRPSRRYIGPRAMEWAASDKYYGAEYPDVVTSYERGTELIKNLSTS